MHFKNTMSAVTSNNNSCFFFQTGLIKWLVTNAGYKKILRQREISLSSQRDLTTTLLAVFVGASNFTLTQVQTENKLDSQRSRRMRIDAQCIAFPANSIVCRCFRAQTDAHVDVCYQMLVRGINLINNGISIEQLFTLSIV